jgi:hypothetical protein
MRSFVGGVSHQGLRAQSLVVLAVAVCALFGIVSTAQAATFDPDRVISDENMRDYRSMSASQIQAFLNTQKGPLKTLVTADHDGKKKSAAVIISEACTQWQISPKVMLTMLQKEQSLLTRTSLLKNTLDRAIGAGCPGGSRNDYPGFGKQMWYGARLLDGYGEGKNGSHIALWKAPYTIVNDIYQSPHVKVRTRNLGTYKLYIYNPSIGAKSPYGDLSGQVSSLSGNANFWWIYRKYFGDPLAPPPGYHTMAVMVRTSQLWNSTIGTKRSPSPVKGGIVNVRGNLRTVRGKRYIDIWWGGNHTGGSVLYYDIRWWPTSYGTGGGSSSPPAAEPAPAVTPKYPYHTKAVMRRTSQLWDPSITTQHSPSPQRGGTVDVKGNLRWVNGKQYIDVWWGGNRSGGSVRYADIKWL